MKIMEKLMTNPQLRQMEIDMVSEIVEQCNSMKDAALAAKAIDSLEINQPNEEDVIRHLRNYLCDVTFKLFIEKYPTN
jgi:hypothetical protein